ncbi:MAG: hypothetical protein R2851_17025 [Caldilineaceae bacterium]
MPIRSTIRRTYPHARPRHEAFADVLDSLVRHHNIDLERVLMATSLCADEANDHSLHEMSYVRRNAPDFMLDTFNLGGLAGFPFTGVMGMTAFAQHVPDHGAALIVYGPHVGVTDDGDFGVMQRWGQVKLSAACGSLMAAVRSLQLDCDEVENVDSYQQDMVRHALFPHRDEILRAANPLLAATEIAYRLIDRQLRNYVAAAADAFTCRHVALWGGLFINTGSSFDTYIDERTFEVFDVAGLAAAAG